MKSLVGEPLTMTALFSEKMTLYANEQGRALAKLHRVSGSLSSDLIDTYDLITTLENWDLPETTKVALQWQLDLPSGFADAFLSKVIHYFPDSLNKLFTETRIQGTFFIQEQKSQDLLILILVSKVNDFSIFAIWEQRFYLI